MSWPARRPDFMPAAAWEAAQALRDRVPPLSAAEAGALERLLDDWRMADTWRSWSTRTEASADEWRLLLELFVFSVPESGFRPALRTGLAGANDLLPRIATHAAALAALLTELRELEGAHNLDVLPMDMFSLLEEAGHGGPWGALDQDPDLLAALPDMLLALADIAGEHVAMPSLSHEAYATTPKSARIPEWVRYVAATHRLYYAMHLPLGLQHLTDAELADAGAAVLNLAVPMTHVKKYRRDAPADLEQGTAVLMFPAADGSS